MTSTNVCKDGSEHMNRNELIDEHGAPYQGTHDRGIWGAKSGTKPTN